MLKFTMAEYEAENVNVMSNNYEDEKDNLKICIEQYERRIYNLLDTLEWTPKNTLKEHKTNKPLFEYQEEICDKNDPLYPEILVAKNFVKFDNETLQRIFKSSNKGNLTRKFSDFQVKFNQEEKLSLYQYVIEKTGNLTEPEVSVLHCNDNNDNGSSNKKMTFSEIVALRRDQKRRRLKYRTTKAQPLSVTEELRNVIEIQMQAFNQYLTQSANETINKKQFHRENSTKKQKRKRDEHKRSRYKHKKNAKK